MADPAAAAEQHRVDRTDRFGFWRQTVEVTNHRLLERVRHVEAGEAECCGLIDHRPEIGVGHAELVEIEQHIGVSDTLRAPSRSCHGLGRAWERPIPRPMRSHEERPFAGLLAVPSLPPATASRTICHCRSKAVVPSLAVLHSRG